ARQNPCAPVHALSGIAGVHRTAHRHTTGSPTGSNRADASAKKLIRKLRNAAQWCHSRRWMGVTIDYEDLRGASHPAHMAPSHVSGYVDIYDIFDIIVFTEPYIYDIFYIRT